MGTLSSSADTNSLNPESLPPIHDVDASTITEQLTLWGEPTMSSLGLGSYWPPGLVQNLLEYIHVYCDLPWFGSIITMAVLIRLLKAVTLWSQRDDALMLRKNTPTMLKLSVQGLEASKAQDDPLAEQKFHELMELVTRSKVMKFSLLPLIDALTQISVYFGLKAIANYPVESFKTGGALWFTDLTVADPYFILPLVSATVAVYYMTGHVGRSAKAGSPHMKGLLTIILPLGIFSSIASEPAMVNLYVTTIGIVSMVLRETYMNDANEMVKK